MRGVVESQAAGGGHVISRCSVARCLRNQKVHSAGFAFRLSASLVRSVAAAASEFPGISSMVFSQHAMASSIVLLNFIRDMEIVSCHAGIRRTSISRRQSGLDECSDLGLFDTDILSAKARQDDFPKTKDP
jgi:hypothetical protein